MLNGWARTIGPTLAGCLGLALIAFLIRQAGVSTLIASIRDVGIGFPAIVLLYSVVIGVTLQSWRELLQPADQVSAQRLLRIKLIADAFNALTPFGSLGGEPYRVAASSRWYGRQAALKAVIFDRLLDQLAAAAVMLLAGATALWFPRAAASGGIAPAAAAVQTGWLERLRDLAAVPRGQRPALIRAFCWRLTGRLLSVVEIAIILASLGFGFRWRVALIAVAVNIGMSGLFGWIPGALGASEAGITAAVAWTGVGAHVGLTIALVRRLRSLCWSAVGLVILFTTHGQRDAVKPLAPETISDGQR